MRFISKRFLKISAFYFVLTAGLLLVPLPSPLFNTSYSTTLLDENSNLLGAKISEDDQWRFASDQELNKKYIEAVLLFEDKNFYSHPGVDPKAIARAIYTNIKGKRVVSGGSTITMQLARIIEGNQSRTLFQKLKELYLSLRLELHFSKDEILKMYADHAPFGGNTVGISSASWRYFGRTIEQLSWSEASLLAILPNSPSLIHLSRSREKLKEKRDRLLKKLHENGYINKQDLELSLLEPLPDKPRKMPQYTPLLMQTVISENKDKSILKTTINKDLQLQVREIAKRHIRRIADEGVHNLSIIVVENKTMKIKAYIGNESFSNKSIYANQLDIVKRARSTGSTLKPFLYASALDAGYINPNTIILDTPSYYSGYMPTNYDERYRGAVSAKDALIKSLNVPTVKLLYEYGHKRFYEDLKNYGMSTLHREADEYGLALILGGAETTLYDLSMIYANISSISQGHHNGEFWSLNILEDEKQKIIGKSPISQGAAYLTIEAIKELRRPGMEGILSSIMDRQEIAWKTGTSYGLRDAWAIGTTPKYTVGVWAGNATGEGAPEISGTMTAAPVLFDVFRYLRESSVFERPDYALKDIDVCIEDGYLATDECESVRASVPLESRFTQTSPYRVLVHLDKNSPYRVNSECENAANMYQKNYFILPPVAAFYYKKYNTNYKELPRYRKECENSSSSKSIIEINYPVSGHNVYLPQELDGTFSKVILKAMHQKSRSRLYWHIDDKYIGETIHVHDMSVFIKPGRHTLLVMDPQGNSVKRAFKVLSKDGTF